jgi:CheY-like chemotaxis protein
MGPQGTSASEKLLVLVIGPNDDVYEQVSDVLAGAGFWVEGVGGPAAALERAARELPSLLVVDLTRRPDWQRLIGTLRRGGAATRGLPIIALVHPLEEIAFKRRDTGCADALAWPADSRRLVATVRRVVGAAEEGRARVPGVERPILIVDDDEDLRGGIAGVLAAEGYSVREARNGREGLERLHEEPHPRLVLLDMVMPDMDGWDFRRAQRSDPEVANVPVIIVSGVPEYLERREATGIDTRLIKPFDVDQLLQAVARWSGGP